MLPINTLIVPIAFLFLLTSQVNGQQVSIGEDWLRQAEYYSKNALPDSAVLYYEKAAKEFKAQGNFEKLIHSYNQMGVLLTRQDKYAPAKIYLEKALAENGSLQDSNHLVIAATYIALGVVYNAAADYKRSLQYHNRCLEIRLLRSGEYNADVATSYGNIGNVYLNSKEPGKSIEAHLKAMHIREKLFGKTSVEVAQSYTNLGNAYREKKDFVTSKGYFVQALQNKIIQLGQGHKNLVAYYKKLSEVCYLMDYQKEGDLYKKKWEEIEKNPR